MPLERASSKSGSVSGLGIWASKYLSTSAWSSIHHRGKKVVSASSGNSTNFEPRESGSFSISTSRLTTPWRLSARWIGPSWEADTFKRRDTAATPFCHPERSEGSHLRHVLGTTPVRSFAALRTTLEQRLGAKPI